MQRESDEYIQLGRISKLDFRRLSGPLVIEHKELVDFDFHLVPITYHAVRTVKGQHRQTYSQDLFPYISLKNWLGEIDKRSKHFPLMIIWMILITFLLLM